MTRTRSLDSLSPEQRAMVEQRMRGRRPRPQRHPESLPPVPTEPVPVSAEQRQMIFHTYLAPGNPVYNEVVTIIMAGPLDVECLRVALSGLLARHDIFRTTFRRMNREPHQIVGPVTELDLPVTDLRRLPPEERDAAASELVVPEAVRRYDLKAGPLVRPLLVRTADDEHRLYLAMHHIVFDGVALERVVLPELVALYAAARRGEEAALPPAVQYSQYATWQRDGALDDQLRRHLPYWRDLLRDAPTLALPITRPRPAEPQYRGASVWFELPARLVEALTDTAAAVGGTLFHALVAGYARLLQSWGAQDDIVLSTVADLRRREEFEAMVGYCLTPVPLRLLMPHGLPVPELIAVVRDTMLDALSHTLPFERIVDDLNPVHEPGSAPIFQTQIVLEPPSATTDSDWSLKQLDPRIARRPAPAKNDVHIELDPRPEGHVVGCLIVNDELFEPDFAQQAVADLISSLEALVRPGG